MSGLIDRIQDRTARTDERPRVLDVGDEEADAVIRALSSDTRREVFRTLFDDPGTASEIADRLDTSVQNVHYHLSSLTDAGLVEGVDTRYSEKGNEMVVYGPANDPIVFVGNRDIGPSVRRSLVDVVAGLGVLGLASAFVQWGAERLAGRTTTGVGVVEPASRAPTADPSLPSLLFSTVEPGLLFFAGCLLVLALVAALRRR
ncbi:ArsR/SmtB family transcription factor [Halopelagius longus]|uniref:ArsR family transcriptional regulator n=1 Tax=Halopelagius longus TaxID=1236180 RepID=A0A1H0YCJ0_9EURY|nr:helix-turn-helix domain-containing protein [Halopelagius longus]RDI72410.1 ArsR family transcriptional regulator [Halopelagius longus]SDQ12793.1 transcriptional regulator, ArsR family [Halopelagius longus]